MRTLQNIDAELKDLNSIINNLYTLQETAKNDEEYDACQVEIDRYSAERHRLEVYRHEARIYHNYHSGAYDSDGDFIS